VHSHSQSPLTQPHRLALIEQARKSVLDTRDPSAPPALSSWIDRSWRHCLGMGDNPHQPIAFDPVTHSAVRYAIDTNQPLLRAAAPVIQSLTRAISGSPRFQCNK
jgi:transcriptional regulator of acetoin/glycerol metabolism